MQKAIATLMMGAVALISSAGAAGADPLERLCDGPRDGKAVVQRLVCPPR